MCWPVQQLVAVASESVLPLLLMNAIEPVLFVKAAKVDLEDACLLVRPAVDGDALLDATGLHTGLCRPAVGCLPLLQVHE